MSSLSRFGRGWWAALAVLVVNDHVLKHAGLLPGWLTGKLSDFAGLIVAPVLAARLSRARTVRVRAIAFGSVVAVFCAVKLSPSAARTLEAALGWIGITWRLWCDPTDLIALAVLPLSWRISRAQAPARRPLPPQERHRGVLGVILGAVACLATSQSLPVGFHTSAYLVNMTLDPLDVRIYRARGPLDCAAVASAPASALGAAFDPALCAHLGAGRVVPIDRNWWATEAPPDAGVAPPADPPCDAVIIRVAGLPDTLLVWQQPGYAQVADPVASNARDGLDPHGIYLERLGDRIVAAGTPLIAAVPSTIPLPDIDCGAAP